jgi:hypothetical protein
MSATVAYNTTSGYGTPIVRGPRSLSDLFARSTAQCQAHRASAVVPVATNPVAAALLCLVQRLVGLV